MHKLLFILFTFFLESFAFELEAPEQKKYECHETEDILVDTSEVFEGHCVDKTGELYQDGDIKTSCCKCIRYECTHFDELLGKTLYFWNTTVSESCCITCNETVVPENTKIDTKYVDDECLTVKTSVCRTIPGSMEATIEYDFTYRNCCNDNSEFLHSINTTVLEHSTCSERTCFYAPSLPHTIWKSKQVTAGCNCCELNGKLVQDGHEWFEFGVGFECCKGEIVKKIGSATTEAATNPVTETVVTQV